MVQAQGLKSMHGASAADKACERRSHFQGLEGGKGRSSAVAHPGNSQEAKKRATRKFRNFAFGHLTRCYPGDSSRLRSVECRANVILSALAND